MDNVATVPTVYGIETYIDHFDSYTNLLKLQQYLPFTVLKLYSIRADIPTIFEL